MKKLIFTLMGLFAFAATSLAGVASPSLSPIIPSNNFATEGLKMKGMTTLYIGNQTQDYGSTLTSNSAGINHNWENLFLGFDYTDNRNTTNNSYVSTYGLGWAWENFSIAATSGSDAANNTATGSNANTSSYGFAWRLGGMHLGVVNIDDGTTASSNGFGFAFVAPEAFRIEYSSLAYSDTGLSLTFGKTEIEALFGPFLIGHANTKISGDASSTSGDTYIGWNPMKGGGLSITLHSYTDSEATFVSGSKVAVGYIF